MNGTLPSDPFVLLSFVNTQLRDVYPTLDEMCASMDVDKAVIVRKLADAGFSYDEPNNRFW